MMRRRRHPYSVAVLVASIALACAASTGSFASAASSTSTVSVTVASATNLDASACASGTANVTDMGTLLPNQSSVTSSDCTVTFGSSNDTAQLKIGQSDISGAALWRPTMGELDAGFDSDGKATTTMGTFAYTNTDMATQSDGKLVVAGSANNGANYDFALVRYATNGSLDTTFDTDGKQITSLSGGDDIVNGITVQADGKIVLVGRSAGDYAIVRYNTNGSLDTTFDTDGIALVDVGALNDEAHAVIVQADGKIVVVGYSYVGVTVDTSIARMNSDGSLDTTFSGDGKLIDAVSGNSDEALDVTLQADNKIVLTGYAKVGADPKIEVVRVTSAGAMDTTFSGDGKLTTSIGTDTDQGHGIAMQSDGKIVVGGIDFTGANYDSVLVRYNSDGSLDTTFDTDGIVNTILSANSSISEVIVTPAGKIMAAGTLATANVDVSVLRYNADGSFDTTFDSDGKLAVPVGAGTDSGNSIVGQSDGRVAVGGNTGGSHDFFAVQLNSQLISNYSDTVSDWDTASSTNMFGACLRAVAGGASAQWTASATCPTTDGAYWNAIPTTATKIAYAASAGTTAATASLRFGTRTSSSQPPGTYTAPVTFDVLAPNT